LVAIGGKADIQLSSSSGRERPGTDVGDIHSTADLRPKPANESDGRVRTVSRAQVRQPINDRGLGRWKAYANELTPLIAELERAGSLDAWCDKSRTRAP